MQLAKRIKPVHLFLAIFVALFLSTRLPGLSNDNVNPDGHNWHIRSEQFMNGIKYAQFVKTYQHYQPGTTLMWIIGPSVEMVKQLNPGFEVYNEITFPTFHYVSKVVLVFVQLVLTIVAFYLLEKHLNWKTSLAILALFTFEPFFVGNSRVLHMDVLLTLFLFNGLLLCYWHLQKPTVWKGIFAGIFLGASFLTKSVGIGGLLFVLGVGGLYLLKTEGIKSAAKYKLTILIPVIITSLVLLPALWTDFSYVVGQIYDGIARVGIRSGHNQVFFGGETRDPGILFYPVVLFLKSSALLWAGLILYVVNFFMFVKSREKSKRFPLTLWLGIFYLGYLVVMTIGSKKIDRYILPMFPYFAMLAVFGYQLVYGYAKDLLKNRVALGLFGLFIVVSIAVPLVTKYPYYFTYTNPAFGSPASVHRYILAQKPFGIGMFAVRDYILENHGNMNRIALLDAKPMYFLYDKDKVKLYKVDGTRSYEILILGVNEEIPGKVEKSDAEFILEKTIKINGLDYWRIYVKSDQAE